MLFGDLQETQAPRSSPSRVLFCNRRESPLPFWLDGMSVAWWAVALARGQLNSTCPPEFDLLWRLFRLTL